MLKTVTTGNKAPEYTYHVLRSALEKFHRSIPELDPQQYQQVLSLADKTYSIESIVLSTPEARDVQVPEHRVDDAVQEVRQRYTTQQAFLQDLVNNGLDEETLRSALQRELMFDAVMDRVTARAPDISDIDIQIFYQLHKDRFTRPETRKAQHILITVNDEYAENERTQARERIEAIHKKLITSPSRFESLARKYSECPTAMDGGKLGEVKPGVLYSELEQILFNMQEGEISGIVESEMGFHVLYCEKINKSVTLPLSRAKPRIRQTLQERQRKACQKAWLNKLQEHRYD